MAVVRSTGVLRSVGVVRLWSVAALVMVHALCGTAAAEETVVGRGQAGVLPVVTARQASASAGYDVILVPRDGVGQPRILTSRGWDTSRPWSSRTAEPEARRTVPQRRAGNQVDRGPVDRGPVDRGPVERGPTARWQGEPRYDFTPRNDARPYRPRWLARPGARPPASVDRDPARRYGRLPNAWPPTWRNDGAGAIRPDWRRPQLDQRVTDRTDGTDRTTGTAQAYRLD